jgi:two-component system, NarL family, sensor histidine kinase BarA
MIKSAINWQDCVRQSGNKAQLAKELLSMFALELPQFQQKINAAWKSNDINQLKFHIHKLHGSCCYCGANMLKQHLHELENAIHSLSPEDINTQIQQLHTEIEQVIRSLNEKDYL